jgi:hypothetical protein
MTKKEDTMKEKSALVVRDICFVPKKGKKGQEELKLSVTTVRTYDETKEDVQKGEFPGDTLEEQLATLLVNLFIGKLEIEEYHEKTLEGVKFYLMDMCDIVSEAIYTSPEKDCKYGLKRYRTAVCRGPVDGSGVHKHCGPWSTQAGQNTAYF